MSLLRCLSCYCCLLACLLACFLIDVLPVNDVCHVGMSAMSYSYVACLIWIVQIPSQTGSDFGQTCDGHGTLAREAPTRKRLRATLLAARARPVPFSTVSGPIFVVMSSLRRCIFMTAAPGYCMAERMTEADKESYSIELAGGR